MNERFHFHIGTMVANIIAWFWSFRFSSIIGMVTLNAVGTAPGQMSLPPIPSNAELLVHFENPSALAEELAWLRSKLEEDDQFREILIGEPFPLLPEEGVPIVCDALKAIESVLHETKSFTLVVGQLHKDPVYLLLIETNPDGINRSLEMFRQSWQLIGTSIDSIENDEDQPNRNESETKAREAKQLPAIDLYSETSRWTTRLLPRAVNRVGDYLIVSNSKEWQTWMEMALTNNREPTIVKSSLQQSRRFQRSIGLISKNQQSTGYCWFLPHVVFPLWDSKITEETLKRLGYEEMVGASLEFSFGSHFDSKYRVRMKMSVPFTVPETGIVKIWKSYHPIKKIPPIADYIEKSEDDPWMISITNYDRQQKAEIVESIHRENGELDKLEEKYKTAAEYYPSVENYKTLYDGSSFRLTMLGAKPQPQYYSMDFEGIESQEAAQVYFPFFAEMSAKGSKYRMEEVSFDGFPGRFYSAEDNLRKAEFDFGRKVDPSERNLLRNPGIVLTPRWIVTGDRNQLQEYFDEPNELEVDAATEINRVFPMGDNFFESVEPSEVEISFPDRWLHELPEDYRIRYLNTKMSIYKARDLVLSTMRKKESLMLNAPVENGSDRVFYLGDWTLNTLLHRYNNSIKMFSAQDQHFEWHWYIFEKK